MSMPHPSEYDLLDRLAEEFAERYRRGERPALQEYVDRHPELADDIRKLFPAMVQVEQAEDDRREWGGLAEDAPAPLLRQVGDYRILREIGRGGMGVVYEAEQVSLGRRVALKVLPRQVAKDGQAEARFRREARSAAKLHHTNIVPVFEVGHEGDIAYYAMQFIEGQGLDLVIAELRRLRTLSSTPDGAGPDPASPVAAAPSTRSWQLRMATRTLLTGRFGPQGVEGASTVRSEDLAWNEGPEPSHSGGTDGPADAGTTDSAVLPGGVQLSTAESGHRHHYHRSVARIGQQAATALAHAHARGIVHRDVKPSNLLLDTDGMVWITDFGLAKSEDDGLTNPGDILGTLRYMAPERFRGGGDARADLYALGLTLYELLTLQPAFDSPDRLQLIEQVKNLEPVRPRAVDPRIPRDLETVVLKAIDKDPMRRYQSAEDLAEDLRRFIADEPIQARRVGPWQRAVLWARRRPAEATLAAVGSLAALALLVGTAWGVFWYGPQLRKEQAATRASQYFQNMALANTAWRDGSMGRLEQLLDECPVDHQGHWEWRYLKRQCHRESRKLVGHKGAVFKIKYSRDGKHLASASLDGTLKLWDTATGQALKTFVGHTNVVAGVAFSPDGKWLASASWDGTVRLWDATTGLQVRSFDVGGGLHLFDVAFSPDGGQLASGGADGTVRVWDLKTGERADWTGGHAVPVRGVVYSPNGERLASTGADGTVNLWNTKTRRIIFRLVGHRDMAPGVAFSPDGKHLATGSFDRTVRIWDVTTGEFVRVLKGHGGVVWGVAFSPDGKCLASSSADPGVKLWDWESGEELRTIRCHGGAVHDVAFSPDGTRLATASHDLTIKIWDLTDIPEARILSGHAGPVNGLAFHPRGKIVASAGQDKTIKLWDVATGRVRRTLGGGHDGAVLCLAFSPGGEILVSADKKGVVRLWDTATGRMSQKLDDDHGGEVSGVAFRPDGEHLATAGRDGGVRVWEVKTLRRIRTDTGHHRLVCSLAYSPDGKYLASGGEDQTVIVRDATGGLVISASEGHTCWVHGVAYSPDGHSLSTATGIGPEDPATARLVSGSGDGKLKLWNTTTGGVIRTIYGHGADVWAVAFSPDGGRLASASIDRTVKLWDPASGSEVLTLTGHTGGVLSVAFSPEGNLLASAARDGTVRIWDARSWPPSSPEQGIDPGSARRP